MSLFQLGDFTLHSGDRSEWLIDCGALTDDDLRTLAKMATSLLPPFERVIGIPRGGLRFARALEPYATVDSPGVLLVDDVYTTGASMRAVRDKLFHEDIALGSVMGLVIFSRTGNVPWWIQPLFVFGEQA